MKKLMILAGMAVIAAACTSEPAFEETEEIGPYTVNLVEKNVWHVEDCNSSNPHGMSIKEDGSFNFNACTDMYIVKGKKKAILIDLSNKIRWADNADESLRKIFYDRAGDREKIITVTHNHGDHTGMLPAFKDEPGITFILPENDFKADNKFPETRQLIGDSGIIDLGGMVLECVQCEGHTPGSMIFFLKGHNIAFSGDAIGSGTGVWIFDMNGMNNYKNGIDRLLEYLDDPDSGIDKASFEFLGGHTYQKGETQLNYDYVVKTKELIEQMAAGTAQSGPASSGNRMLDTCFKNGDAAIVWNKALADQYAGITPAAE